jgi:hypothetical protein
METDKASERRVADLLKIYDRGAVNSTYRRIKTEADDSNRSNPEGKQQDKSNKSFKRIPFLPAIDRIQVTSDLKGKQEEKSDKLLNQSHQ